MFQTYLIYFCTAHSISTLGRICHASTPFGVRLPRFHAAWSVSDTTCTSWCRLRRLRCVELASTPSRAPLTYIIASRPSRVPQTCMARFHAVWSVSDTIGTSWCRLRRLRCVELASTPSRAPLTYIIASRPSRVPQTCMARFHAVWSVSDTIGTSWCRLRDL
jgi:hypothetical protein